MHRIAIIADIHANLFALEAVIDDLERRDVDEVMVAGDLVGRGPQGNAVIHRIQELGWSSVRGNHEDYLLSFYHGDIPDSWRHDEQWAASRWMADELDAAAVTYIESLPFSRRSKLDSTVEVFHGSPNSHSEGIGHWTPQSRLREFLDTIDGSVLVCAHTHRPLTFKIDAGLVVNVGSVGLPFNGDWRAQYAILQGHRDQWEASFHRIPYPRQQFLDLYQSSGFLSQGAITAKLLHYEVRHARPFLVPFLKWVELTDRTPRSEHLADFIEVYDPAESMATFLEKTRRTSQRSSPS